MRETECGTPSMRSTLSFFLPLALTSAMTMVSHSLISAGLARTVNPVASLAAYSVALATEDLFESPIIQTRQMTLALLRGPRSFKIISRVAATALLISLALGLLVAATPLGPIVFSRVLGVPNELLQPTLHNFWIVMLLPILAGARSFFQGVVIRYRQTHVITTAMVGRVALMAGFIYSCVRWGWIKGGYIGSIALNVGVLVELAAAAAKSRKLLSEHREEDDRALTDRSAWRFYYPLAIAAVLASTAKPWVTAGIARRSEAAAALAAYSVAWSVGSILINPMQNIHQTTLVMGRGPNGDQHVRRFALAAGCSSAGLLLILSLSPLGHFILTDWIGVSDTLLTLTLRNLRVMAVLPLIISCVEYLMGQMLAKSLTRVISTAKVANLLATMAAVSLLARRSAVVGPLSLIIGAATELAALAWGWYRSNEVGGAARG
ncbi:MAG: hypothetical protein ACM3ZQ_04290 [Bacillota bacterium]